MNVEETLKLLNALKSAGATHFKSNDFEVTLDASSHMSMEQPVAEHPQASPETPPPVPEEINEEATAKMKDLISTLRMNDQELADHIFPAGAL